MIPILYQSREKDFTSNGIGRLADAISCLVTEERNGTYELVMEYPIDGIHYEDIAEDQLIVARASDGALNQIFRVYKIDRPINGKVKIYAEHISYLLNKLVVMPFEASSCQDVMTKIPVNTVNSNPFTFTTDKTATGTFKIDEPKAIRGLLGGESGSILDVYGKGDYEFNNFNVILRVSRGSDNGVVLRYGKNITDLQRVTNMTNTYVGIVPFWKSDETTVTLSEKVVLSDYANKFAYQIIKPVDFSSEWEEAPTQAQLRARAQKYVKDNEGWEINDNIEVSFVNLADTLEYEDVANLERVRLCDTITVLYSALGISVKAQVVKTVWDTLKDKYDSIEIGNSRTNLSQAITEEIAEPVLEEASSHMQQALAHATKLITGGLGGYVVTTLNANGKPQEILIMNTDNIATATQVIRMNMNGIAFGNGYDGKFNTAWTIDGHFVADFIDTGKLNADIIKAGTLVSQDANQNFSLVLSTGVMTMKKGSINLGSGKFVATDEGKLTAIGGGQIGGWVLEAGANGALYKNMTSFDDTTNNGVWIGPTTGIALGKGAFKVTTAGALTATSGKIAGWVIDTNSIYYGTKGSGTADSDVTLMSSAVFTRKVNYANRNDLKFAIGSKFAVDKTGKIYCGDGDFTGVFNTMQYYGTPGRWRKLEMATARISCYWGGSSATNPTFSSPAAVIDFEEKSDYKSGCGNIDFSDTTIETADGAVHSSSDRRLKTGIETLDTIKAIKTLKALHPVKYYWKDETDETRSHHGFIAQEVEEIIDDDWWVAVENKKGYYTLGYSEFIADLVAVAQNQQERIEKLEEALYGKAIDPS